MNHLDHQDRKRYWKISQVKNAAHVFADAAGKGFAECLGHLAEGEAKAALSAMGPIFRLTGNRIEEVEKTLDRAIDGRSDAQGARRLACLNHEATYDAARGAIRCTRQFADSQTGGKGDLHLGVSGPTPRDSEKLAGWGLFIYPRLPGAVPPAARPLAQALAAQLEAVSLELDEANQQAQAAREHEKTANLVLAETRKAVDAEVDKVKQFLRSSLELVGHDELARRVLGKRRGRPRKSAEARQEASEAPAAIAPESDVALSETAEARPEFDSSASPAPEDGSKSELAPSLAPEAGRKIDSAPPSTGAVGPKFASAADQRIPDARAESREIEKAPGEACTPPEEIAAKTSRASPAGEEIVEGSSDACTALEKIAEAPCKPCTEPSGDAEVASFQEVTPRATRRRRRRVAAKLLGASARLLPSAFVRRFVAGNRWQRRGADRS